MKTDGVKLKEAFVHHSKKIVSPNNKLCVQEIIDVVISVKQIRHMSQHRGSGVGPRDVIRPPEVTDAHATRELCKLLCIVLNIVRIPRSSIGSSGQLF